MKYTATFVLLCVLCACQQTATNLSPEPISSGPIIAASSVPDLSTVEEDLAFKAELAKLLEQMEPGIQEKTQATGLTLEHAQSLIEDLDDSDFKLKSSYQPVPHSNLETRLLQENIFMCLF